MSRSFIVGVFDDEHSVLDAVYALNKLNFKVEDVFGPCPIHGIDHALGLKRSRLPYVTGAAGLFGLVTAMSFQIWSGAVSWPMIIGGKNFNAWQAYVPVAFEFTVLCAAFATVGAFFLRSKIFPMATESLVSKLVTISEFSIVVDNSSKQYNVEAVSRKMKDLGASKVELKEVSL